MSLTAAAAGEMAQKLGNYATDDVNTCRVCVCVCSCFVAPVIEILLSSCWWLLNGRSGKQKYK
jgi:hypothetical protein